MTGGNCLTAVAPAESSNRFGSVVIPDPERVTDMIIEAQKVAGVRLLVSSGWAKLGEGMESTSDIFWLNGER